MGKTRRGHKERSREQELKYENQKLRREVSNLRKQLARLDLDRHSYVRDIVEEHLAGQEVDKSTQSMLESMKNTWRCNKCKEGHLQIETYSKSGETWYYRSCSNECGNRTVGKPYDPNSVKGILAIHNAEPQKPDRNSRSFKR